MVSQQRDDLGRFIVTLPMKEGVSRSIAVRRFKARKRSLKSEDSHPPTSHIHGRVSVFPSNTATHVPVTNVAKFKDSFDVKEWERKFNFVVSGLPKCPDGTPKKTRVFKDEEALVDTALCKQVPLYSSLSIRDCVELGKGNYKANCRPRPIFVTLNKGADVTCVLSTHVPQNGIRVRPDLSPAARKLRARLLAEGTTLIDGGTIEPRKIKLRGDCTCICIYTIIHWRKAPRPGKQWHINAT